MSGKDENMLPEAIRHQTRAGPIWLTEYKTLFPYLLNVFEKHLEE